MNVAPSLLLLTTLYQQPVPPTPRASILGMWRLKAVHLLVQNPDGTPPYGLNPHIRLGSQGQTFTKEGRWTHWQDGNRGASGPYQLRKSRLLVVGSEGRFPYQIRVLTATQLVLVIAKTEGNGVHAQEITTYVR